MNESACNGRRLGFWLGVITTLILVLSCSGSFPRPRGRDCLVVPVSSLDLPASTRLRARVRIGRGDRELGLEAIIRKRSDELVVVGLAPEGTRLFAVRQRGREIEIDSATSREMEYLALWLMDALHRGLFIAPTVAMAAADATSFSWAGEQVTELRTDGHRHREFRRTGEPIDVAPVAIDYREGSGFEIRNAWCGYEAILIPVGNANREPVRSDTGQDPGDREVSKSSRGERP